MKLKGLSRVILTSIMLFGVGFFVIKNTNAVTYVSESQKQIIRDTTRLNDLTKLKNAIEDYKTTNGYYPKIASGTYVKGYVNSVWSSGWTSFCSLIGLSSSCPTDPLNEILSCDCNTFGSGCNSADLDTTTCYNSKMSKFLCGKDSHIYQYQVLNNGRNYSLMMEFEYMGGGTYGYGNYFNVNNGNDNGNVIDVDGNCVSSSYGYKMISTKTAVCGNGVIESGESCDGGSKVEFCTNTEGKRGRISIKCTSNCVYESKNLTGNSACVVTDFCGDAIKQSTEECDGGSENLCFKSSEHAWYNEQTRYCKENCKYDKDETFVNSITPQMCGGYCGDSNIQSQEECDFGNEYVKWNGTAFKQCSDYKSSKSCGNISGCYWTSNNKCEINYCYNYSLNTCPTSDGCEKKNGYCIPTIDNLYKGHCGIRSGIPCKYKNNPAIFPNINNNNFFVKSYAFRDNYYSYEDGSIDADNKLKISKNSLFFEVGLGGVYDLDGDGLEYKFEFTEASNKNIGFYVSSDSADLEKEVDRPEEITGEWVKYNDIKYDKEIKAGYGYGVFVRIYSTVHDSTNVSNIAKIDGSYFGDYKFKISIRDDWKTGQNVDGNKQAIESSKTFSFYVGSSCGDGVLQTLNDDGQREYCENRLNSIKFSNFSKNEPSIYYNGTLQECVALKGTIGSTVWNGKWDDEACSLLGYGICKGTSSSSGFTYNASYGYYKITDTKKTWDDAEAYCKTYGADLFVVEDIRQNNFINSLFNTPGNLNGENFVWIGHYNINKNRLSGRTLSYSAVGGYGISYGSLITSLDENGDSDVNNSKIIDGGLGKSFSDQYLCSKNCTDIGGFCGDGILENGSLEGAESDKPNKWMTLYSGNYYYSVANFEECDPSVNGGKMQVGAGTSKSDQYACSNCMFSNSGYCGDQKINSTPIASLIDFDKNKDDGVGDHIDFEHCDPTYQLKPSESRSDTSKRGYGANYICWADSNIPSTLENFGGGSERTPWIPKKQDDTEFTGYGDYLDHRNLVNKFVANTSNGVCQRSSGGYCGDGIIQISYNQMPQATRISNGYLYPIYNSTNNYNKGNPIYDKNSIIYLFQYGYGENELLTSDSTNSNPTKIEKM